MPVQEKSMRWRQAFEDLLCSEDDEEDARAEKKPKGPTTFAMAGTAQQATSSLQAGRKDVAAESADKWLRRMTREHLIRPTRERDLWHHGSWSGHWPLQQFDREENPGFHQSGLRWPAKLQLEDDEEAMPAESAVAVSATKEPQSESEMYEHFLSRESTSTSTYKYPLEEHTAADGKSKPVIVGTSTSTERHRVPDGTVTTKTVTTKRFADGTEDRQETSNLSLIHISEPTRPY